MVDTTTHSIAQAGQSDRTDTLIMTREVFGNVYYCLQREGSAFCSMCYYYSAMEYINIAFAYSSIVLLGVFLAKKQIRLQKRIGIETRYRYQKIIAAIPLGFTTYALLQIVTRILFG